MVLGHAEQMIDDFEPLWPVGIIDPGDLHELLIGKFVAQADHHPGNRFAAHGDAVLAHGEDMRDQIAADDFLQCLDNAVARRDQGSGTGHQRSIVPVRRIFRCNCMTP